MTRFPSAHCTSRTVTYLGDTRCQLMPGGSIASVCIFAFRLGLALFLAARSRLALAVLVPSAALVLAVWRLVLIPRQVRAIGYAERDDDLLIRGGIFFQRTMVVPYGRMQYVDIGVGPVERGLGLCTLKLHTASPGTNAQLPGLPAAEGARLREQLSARGEARLAGL